MEYTTEKERLQRMALGHTTGSDLRRPNGGLSFIVRGHYGTNGIKYPDLHWVVSERPKQLPLHE
jgi:hypothetical protein